MKRSSAGFDSFLAQNITRFLTYKRSLGRRFDVEEKALRLLDRFLLERKIQSLAQVTPEIVDAFFASRPRKRPRSYNHLLGVVRRLFDWLVVQELLDRSPVKTRPRQQQSRRIAFVFDLPAARRLLQIAQGLPDNSMAPMRGATYHAIFAILYGLGLRVGEVCRLRVRDVDFERRLLVIRASKFCKSRLVPFGPRMEAMLREYLQMKARCVGVLSAEAAVFSFTGRGEIHPGTVSLAFHALVPRLGLEIRAGSSPPRLHDLRHSFAVGTLLRWYRKGTDPGVGLLKLATFLGHVDASSTAVYLNISWDFLHEANRRFEGLARLAIAEEVSP